MKRNLAALFICFSSLGSFAQSSVGIGTTNPAPSAVLDISCGNKGVLFPRIYLTSLIDNTTVPAPAPSLMLYNTNVNLPGGAGLYYNSNTAASPSWTRVGDLKLPYTAATSSSSPALYIQNYAAGPGIRSYAENGAAFYAGSNHGIGVYASSFAGNALEVSGKIKITGTGQVPGVGKVLTSDANGNATWEGGIAFCSRGIQPGGASSFADWVEKKIPFYTEEYDLGNNYNPSTVSPYSTFTAPVKGIYHFDVKIGWGDEATQGASTMFLKSTFNGITKTITEDLVPFVGYWVNNNISTDVMLEAGTQVFVTMRQGSHQTMSMMTFDLDGSPNAYFSGRLVMKL